MSTQPDPGKTPGPKKIAIDMPKELKAVYANVALISHTPVEVVLDFAQVQLRTPPGTVQARISMSPMHAKLLQMALAQNIQNYERQFGEIRLPNQGSPLVENFFRSTGSGSDEGKQDE